MGTIGGHDKLDLLAGAEALINPILWPEPFGLVMIEAMATGTPVLAFPEGAAPEIVDHGITGFLCKDEDDMVKRLASIGDIDRAACRNAVQRRFTIERMVEDHLVLYRRLIAGRDQPAGGTDPATDPNDVDPNDVDPNDVDPNDVDRASV